MTQFFQWDPEKFSVLVQSMDDEHQRLIAIMNRLHERNEAGAGKIELAGIVKELAAFTVEHFKNEEAHMEAIGFPGLASHKLIHKDLLEKFGGYAEEFEASGELTDEFFLFLRRWLKAHIQGIDRKYGEHGRLADSA